ncbi:HAMP domain-containing sensor histidine kinase [Microbacterium sp.]|uniref:sensor histidine kinase n=1 Tax=Microbacterium sp. TaxID=51671 RepID=UPI0025D7544C|nr:HAMP domain-containing sensor histidine kinase [Microbacterium sp.]
MSDAPGPRRRRRWTLQTRLIVTVVSLVALIVLAVGLATGAILRTIMVDNLDAQVTSAAAGIRITPGSTAEEVLSVGRQQLGTLLVLNVSGETTGAVVSESDVVATLTESQIEQIVPDVDPAGLGSVTVPGYGEYRIRMETTPSGYFALLGLPTSELTSTVTQILTTVALVTSGGLLLLAAVIALVIRRSLKPLRSVADTAARVAAQPLDSGDVTITERVSASEADDSDEIGRVGAALNTLLDHVDTSLAARQRNEERMRSFVADASHELRTPLAAIRGYSELSLRALSLGNGPHATKAQIEESSQHSQHALERIQAASLRMTTLVEDLLLLARLDEGKELVYGAVDLTRVAVDSVADAQAAGPGHEWIIEAGEEPVIVAGDAVRLHQVVANLLANARVHTPDGTRVTTTVRVEGNEAVLRVADDGPGIDPGVADELFERFARADTSRTRQTGGTGLGLSIAKAIATAHHGTLSVSSVPGATAFEVRLPARPETPASAAPAP